MLKPVRIAASVSVFAVGLFLANASNAADLKVVASFSIIEDLAKNVGGDRIELKSIVGPDGDAHVFEPRPADAVMLEKADVVLTNGLQFEGFMTRLIEASGTKATVVEVSDGIDKLKAEEGDHDHDHGHKDAHEGHHHHGEFDPHAWQSVKNAEIYVKNIAKAFCEKDKAGCETYKTNSANYLAKLEALDKEVKEKIEAIPADKRTVITSHDAFGYFERDYGLKFVAPEGLSTAAEASAADVAKLIDQVKHDKASAIFLENITNPSLIEQIAKDTGLKIGGTLYSDALSTASGPASTYIDMFRYNVDTLTSAIKVK